MAEAEGKTNIGHCKVTCRFGLDIKSNAAERAVEFNTTVER